MDAPLVAIAAFRAADLRPGSGRRAAGGPGARVVLAAGQALPVTGEPMTFCHPVVTVPAVVTAAGAVLAGGWLPELVRLGELEAHLGEGVIEDLAERAIADGRSARSAMRSACRRLSRAVQSPSVPQRTRPTEVFPDRAAGSGHAPSAG